MGSIVTEAVAVARLVGLESRRKRLKLDPERIPRTEKAILAGLYLSKFDAAALKSLGFESFTEAFNVIGYALGVPPGSIKNYRDEFDPLFDNARKGWHRRARRENCLKVFDEYRDVDAELFTGLIKSFAGASGELAGQSPVEEQEASGVSQFAKRLITGLAAEHYFEANYRDVPDFRHHDACNTTRIGCGYDFRLDAKSEGDFLAVEVKGLQGRAGGLSLTDKEHGVAGVLRDRDYLFVVKNFRESPYHEVFCNPLSGGLRFVETKKTIVQISWLVNV